MADFFDIPESVAVDNEFAESGRIITFGGSDVKVDNPAQAAKAILAQVDTYLKDEKLISAKMTEICREATRSIIENFATLNADEGIKLVEHAVIVQERFAGGKNFKEMGFEIDSDPRNDNKIKQEPHFGAEISWGKSADGEHTGGAREPWRFKEKGFKMHAETIKEAAPYYRHQAGFPSTTDGPETEWKEGDKYRVEYWRIELR